MYLQFSRTLVEKSTGRSIKCLRTDNGGEFTSMEFENYCKEFGIDRHKTTAYTQQNGVVERMNRWCSNFIHCEHI
jgi:transposase InsO family protein